MFKKSIIAFHRSLSMELRKLSSEYYLNPEKSTKTDSEYDALLKKLTEIEAEYPELITDKSPSQTIGVNIKNAFTKTTRSVPMMSLSNAFTNDDLIAFDKNIKSALCIDGDIPYLCETKYDGMALSLVYKEGVLFQASTRGDGIIGEVVTDQALMIKNIPINIPKIHNNGNVEIRGEVIMTKLNFSKLNQTTILSNKQPFANARNAAAGGIRNLDPLVTKSRNLEFMPYSLISSEEHSETPTHQSTALISLEKDYGFSISKNFRRVIGISNCINFCSDISMLRKSIDYDIDGVVIKLDDLSQYNKVGHSSKSPKAAIAWKFEPESVVTEIVDVKFQVGRTGVITPVAKLTPVAVGGVVVSNATLHNAEELKRLGVYIGASVIVSRAGDVIPKITSILPMNSKNKLVDFPTLCPSCKSELGCYDGEVAIRCFAGHNCEEQSVQALVHYVSRDAMNIIGIGEQQIRQLYSLGMVNKPSDLYKLTVEKLLFLERFGIKSANKIINSISKSKKTTLARFIYSLGIDNVGLTSATTLANHFRTLDNITVATLSELTSCPDIGPITAESIRMYMTDSFSIELIMNLEQSGIHWDDISKSSIVYDKSVVVTGSFESISRDAIYKALSKHGYKKTSGVSSKTDLVVVGSNPGSKLAKANKLGIRIMESGELMELISKD